VTDLDYLVGLGHQEEAVRNALLIARGNRNAALYLLAKKGDASAEKGQLSWRKETSDDWVEGPAKTTPNLAENRALHKSPIYIFVEDYHPGDNEYVYMMQITLKDGRQWKIGHTYTEFTSFYNSLPFGTCRAFTNSFPPISKYQFVFGGDLPKFKLDRRLAGLAEWMRELTLNEACMSNPKILDLLYDFVEADSNGGRPGAKKPAASAGTEGGIVNSSVPALLNTTSPLLLETQDSTEVAAAKRKSAYVNHAPLLTPEQLPITVEQAVQLVPFKVSIKKLQCYHDLLGMKQSKSTKDVEEAQQSEDDADLAAALAASRAEALAREQFEAEIAPREEPASTGPVTHELDSAASPLHVTKPSGGETDSNEECWVESDEGARESAAKGPPEAPEAASPTICLPPQVPASTSSPVPARLLQRLQSVSFLTMSVDTKQLQKDCHRDRIVVQGKRLDGAHTQLAQIYALCQESILQVMAHSKKAFDLGLTPAANSSTRPVVKRETSTNPFDFTDDNESTQDLTPVHKATGPQCMLQTDEELAWALHNAELSGTALPSPPGSPTSSSHMARSGSNAKSASLSPSKPAKPCTSLQQDCETLSRVALNMISRTESGYLSHASLHEIFDIENKLAAPDFIPFFFVPEATLSDPLQLSFAVLEKGGAPQASRGKYAQPALAEEWCVECTGETSTVYRLMDAVTLVPLLQIRVSYLVTLFAMPQYQVGQIVSGFTLKEGKCVILIDKATTTTSRDWDN